MTALLADAKGLAADLIRHRRHLHRCAEVGFDLAETFEYVKKELERLGYRPEKCGRCGLTATVGTGKTAFLLRADMDALPVREETGLDFVSPGGCMHACGHDLHTAMLLGAAALLRAHEKELKGCVKMMFQPAEEILSGAKDMVKSGVLENPRVTGGAMLHVMTGVPLEAGTAVIPAAGVCAPGASMFEIRVQGRGGHGASPEECIDPINAAAHIVLALQGIKAREMQAQSGAMLTVGALHGGKAPNVIADSVLLGGSLRAYSAQEQKQMLRRAEEIAAHTARAYGARAELKEMCSTPVLRNDEGMVRLAEAVLPIVLGRERVLEAQKMGGARSSGSEDFAYISQAAPTVMLALAAGDSRKGYVQGLHHPRALFDEASLPYGAAALAGLAIGYWDRGT